ncbi:hypothetical protein N5P32_14175 [Marinomonas pontica]|nr:hypothetical protein [Marinomonas pontica]MCW8356981.1 hypothetical protein [Marinomonas pontica]
MFNTGLKNELQLLKDELYSLNQVRDSLSQEMLVLVLTLMV